MADLSLCLPFTPPAQGGGGYGFLRMWEAWLTKQGIPWSRKITDRHPVLFVNSWHTSPRKIFAACLLRPRVTVVHRVNGWPPLYGRTDGIERRLITVNRYADLVIYQSHWAKSVLAPHLGDGPVIYNPVDVETFRPLEAAQYTTAPNSYYRAEVVSVTWSDNPMKGGAFILQIARNNPDVRFRLIGRWPSDYVRANVLLEGVITHREHLAGILQNADALLTMSQHEACPNHVLEAMACGLPVLYLDSGATGEIVGGCGYPVTEETFALGLRILTTERHARNDARLWAVEHFAPAVIFPKYLDAIRTAMR